MRSKRHESVRILYGFGLYQQLPPVFCADRFGSGKMTVVSFSLLTAGSAALASNILTASMYVPYVVTIVCASLGIFARRGFLLRHHGRGASATGVHGQCSRPRFCDWLYPRRVHGTSDGIFAGWCTWSNWPSSCLSRGHGILGSWPHGKLLFHQTIDFRSTENELQITVAR